MGNFKLSIPVDNTYNVASDTHRQNIVSMKESTMNKEIKKRRKEDKDVQTGKKTKQQVKQDRRLRAKKSAQVSTPQATPAEYKFQTEERKRKAGEEAARIEAENQPLQEQLAKRSKNVPDGLGYQALNFLEKTLTSSEDQLKKAINGSPTWGEQFQKTINNWGKGWEDFWNIPIKIDHSFDFIDDSSHSFDKNPYIETTTLGDAVKHAAIVTAIPTALSSLPAATDLIASGIAGTAGGYIGSTTGKQVAKSFGGDKNAQSMFGDIGGFTGATAAAAPVSYKIWSIYNKNPQGFINVTNDVIRHPLATWQARKAGEYPLTTSEQRAYILARRNAIQKGIDYNQARVARWKEDLKQSYMNEGFSAQEAEDLINNIYSGNLSTKYYDAGPAIAKRFGLSNSASAASYPSTWNPQFNNRRMLNPQDFVVFKRRNYGSNLPVQSVKKKGVFNLAGISGHEFNHAAIRHGYKDKLSIYSPEVQYYIPIDSYNTKHSPFAGDLDKTDAWIKYYNENNIPKDRRYTSAIWLLSPEEFLSELVNYRVQGIKNPEKYLSEEFRIPKQEAKDKIKWLDEKGYKSGGKIKYFK